MSLAFCNMRARKGFQSLGNAIARLRLGDHVCLPFGSDEERFTAFADFTAVAVRRGVKVLLLTEVEPAQSMHERLLGQVPSYRDAAASGQVEVAACRDTYLAGGRFDGGRMIEGFARLMDAAERQGYPGLWVSADMAWAADGPGVSGLADYETDANMLFTSGRMAAVCQYDHRIFDAATIAAACSAHPIIDGGAEIRFSLVEEPPGLVLSGELDGTNNRVFAAVLAPLSGVPAPLTIDATGVTFAGVHAAAMLARLAHLRREHTTTVVCRPQLQRLLHLVDTAGNLIVHGTAAHGHNGRPPNG
jgi:anti-anti-sigma regulatory factor